MAQLLNERLDGVAAGRGGKAEVSPIVLTTRAAASSLWAGRTPASDTECTSSPCAWAWRPTSTASRVLPTPPGPTIVTSRQAGSSSSAAK